MPNILEKINKASIRFLEPLTLEETYKTIVDEAMKLSHAFSGSIALKQENQIIRVYSSIPSIFPTRKRGLTYRTLKNKRVMVSKPDIKNHPELKKLGVKTNIMIPLINKKQSIGVLILRFREEVSFRDDELDALKLFGSMASLAIRKTHLYDDVKKALETRDLFISMASHELRTPLTTVNGYIQLLKSKAGDMTTTQAKWVEQLSWETYRLTELVKDLLEIDRIKSGQFQYNWKECSLKEIIERAYQAFKFTHPSHHLEFVDKLKGADIVIGDFDKLLQTLSNLLDNAAKFSPASKPILLTLKKWQRSIIIEVKDQGSGISKEDSSKIFETFYRADQQKEGLGLGLALVKIIVANHQGEIKLKSKLKKGTSISIKLPGAELWA
jgi:K+-sensing histidine kinase KdpD